MTGPELRCRSGKDCTFHTSDGPAATSKPDSLCAGCVENIQKCYDELPHLAQALKTFLGGSMSVSYTSKVHSTQEPQPPMNVTVYDLVDELWDVYERVNALDIKDLVQLPAEKFVLWRRNARREVYLDGIARALDVRRVHGKANNLVGLNRVWQKRAAPCPRCQLPMLGTWVGSDTIDCANEDCRAVFSREQYDEHCFGLSRNQTKRKKQTHV